jgi:mono/diheme cytochrome c family protein
MLKVAQITACAALAIASVGYAQSSGADIYKAKCAQCHGADGTASTPAGKAMKTPSIKGTKATEADMIAATTNGKGKMPAYKGKLTDAQIKEAVSYLETFK